MQSSNRRTVVVLQTNGWGNKEERNGLEINKEQKAINDNSSLIMKLKIRMKLTTQKT